MTRLRTGAIAIGLALCAALSAGSSAMADTGSVSGTVGDDSASHVPIAGAHACYLNEILETVCAETDGAGHYVLSGLSPGPHKIAFHAPLGQNYVDQYYDDAQLYEDADPVTVQSGATVSGIDAEMHEGGTITGTVTEAGSGNPIQGLSVCASGGPGLSFGRCTVSGPGGHYTITGLLPDPKYQVEFFAGKALNYLTQYYNGKEGLDSWDPVPVVAGEVAAGIDAVMNPGAQITGRVTEEGTDEPLAEIEVCAEDPAETLRAQEFEKCAFTNLSGDYAIRSLRAGTFVVGFNRDRSIFGSSRLFEQWYDDAASEAAAERITIAPPQTRTGVDARLVGFPHPKPPSVVVTLIESPIVNSAPLRCRKHFHRRRVKGKVRCVKVHKRHPRRHRPKQGPRAMAGNH